MIDLRHRIGVGFVASSLFLVLSSGCKPSAPSTWQGYAEGEFIYVASPLAGKLETLQASRGIRVEAGSVLFKLETTLESAARDEAAARLKQSRSRLEDLRKGQRPEELNALSARLDAARAVARLSELRLNRTRQLKDSGATSVDDADRAQFTHEANARAVAELEAQVSVAKLGGRPDAISAAEADTAAAEAALAKAEWAVQQKTQKASAAALVFDHLYRPGEQVAAGAPVVSLLPPGNLRVRFFVGEKDYSSLSAGQVVRVQTPGRTELIPARVSYLSPQPEYTPPVLYNRENRAKLVFMVEATPEQPDAVKDLHPGQPLDVSR